MNRRKPQAKFEPKTDKKSQSEPLLPSNDSPRHRKQDSDSIVRGILSNSIKYNHEKPSSEPPITPDRLSNGNGNNHSNGNSKPVTSPQVQVNQAKMSERRLIFL